MVEYLEKLLQDKSQEENCTVLLESWKIEKVKLENKLAAVSNIYPHYSDHSAKHSHAIIMYIVKMLGKEKLNGFSAADIWLLLYTAYYHDVGMALTQEQLQRIFNDKATNEEFVGYIGELQNDISNSMHDQSMLFELSGTIDSGNLQEIDFKNKTFDIKKLDAILSILSGFMRKKHPEMSKEFIENLYCNVNLDNIEMDITTLIPTRLFKAIGTICAAHGWDFNRIMNDEDLHFCELGVGDGDCCHPRMIACLLRLGDLLDLDNYRINMSTIAFIGIRTMPNDSRMHLMKHRSIDHYVVTPKEIEIHATIPINKESHTSEKDNLKDIDEDAYNIAEITKQWFDLIEEEFRNQKERWNDIAPEEYNLALPDIKSLKVDLPEYEYIEKDEKPQFKIDAKRTFELLQGMNLYKTPWQSIREILQNAVDATTIKLWKKVEETVDHKETEENVRKKIEENFKEEYTDRNKKNYDIQINIKSDKEHSSLDIEITDPGIGMTMDDLKYLLMVGSARNNPNKKKLIMNMPPWGKPSGSFGIGFQSIFMLTEKVQIETESYTNEKSMHVTLFSPSGKHKGDVLIKTKGIDHKNKSYTCIKFTLKMRNFENDVQRDNFMKTMMETGTNNLDLDPLSNSSNSMYLNCILYEIEQFKSFSLFPIIVSVDGKKTFVEKKSEDEAPSFGTKIIETKIKEKGKDVLRHTQISIKFIDNKEANIYYGKTDIYYKNQYVTSNESAAYPFINIKFNILSGDAEEWLHLNRNEIKEERSLDIRSIIEQSLLKYLINLDKDTLKEEEEEEKEKQIKLSLLNKVFLSGSQFIDIKELSIPERLKDKYLYYKPAMKNDHNRTLNDLKKECKKITLARYVDHNKNVDELEKDLNFKEGILYLFSDFSQDLYFLELMLLTALRLDKPNIELCCQMEVSNEKKIDDVKIKINKEKEDDKESLEIYFENKTSEEKIEWLKKFIETDKYHAKQRYLIPCLEDKYNVLAINTTKSASFVDAFLPFDLDSICTNLMICPFCKDDIISDFQISEPTASLKNYVHDNSRKPGLEETQIKDLYKEFIEEIKGIKKK